MKKVKQFFTEHRQLGVTLSLALAAIIIFGVYRLVNYDERSPAERYKDRADRHLVSGDFIGALNFYNIALEADPGFEEVYIILYDYHLDNNDITAAWDIISRAVHNTDSIRIRELYNAADYPVVFTNPSLEQNIRHVSAVHSREILRSDLDEIAFLSLSGHELDNLEFLRHFRKLSHLDIHACEIADWSYLAHVTTLMELNIRYSFDYTSLTEVKPLDMPPLGALKSLYRALITGFELSDLSVFSGLPHLHVLTIEHGNISDVSPLTDLPELTYLLLSNNRISDLSPLVGLPSLWFLAVDKNEIEDISPLALMPALSGLAIGYNNISDISPLAELPNLSMLQIQNNNITDISMFADENIFGSMNYLDLRGNPIEDFTTIERFGDDALYDYRRE
jgi:hypothetical protein